MRRLLVLGLIAQSAFAQVRPHGGVDLGLGFTPAMPLEVPVSVFGGATWSLGDGWGLEALGLATFSGRRSVALEPIVSLSLSPEQCCLEVTVGAGASFVTDRYLNVGPMFAASFGLQPLKLVASVRLLDAKPLLGVTVRLDLADAWMLLRRLNYR